MTPRSALLVAFLLLTVHVEAKKSNLKDRQAPEEESACAATVEEVTSLKAEVARLSKELSAKTAGKSAPVQVSVLGAASGVAGMAQDMMQHLLDQTSHDEALAEQVSTLAAQAKEVTFGAADRIAAVDYRAHAKTLTEHPIYVTHVGPTLAKVADTLQPHLDAHVYPGLEKARAQAGPMLSAAQERSKAMYADVVPTLQQKAAQMPEAMDKLEQSFGTVIAPVFDFSKKAAPKHADALPTRPLDRLLLLLVAVMLMYYTLKVTLIVVRILFRIFRVVLKLCLRLLKLAISIGLLPVWVLDCCCLRCCGLRKRKGKVGDLAKKAGKNGKTSDEKKAPAPKATIAEVTSMLEASKKKGKLDPAVKLLAGVAGSGKTMDGDKFPKDVQGKQLEKDVLKKVCLKFKEVDVKKFGL